MVLVPSDGCTSGQEDEKESCDQLHEGAGPEVKTFQLRNEHHLGVFFTDRFVQLQLFTALCGLGLLFWDYAFYLLRTNTAAL